MKNYNEYIKENNTDNKCFMVKNTSDYYQIYYLGGFNINSNSGHSRGGTVTLNSFAFSSTKNTNPTVKFLMSDISYMYVDEWKSYRKYTTNEFIEEYPDVAESLYKKRFSFTRHKLGREMYQVLNKYVGNIDLYKTKNKYNL